MFCEHAVFILYWMRCHELIGEVLLSLPQILNVRRHIVLQRCVMCTGITLKTKLTIMWNFRKYHIIGAGCAHEQYHEEVGTTWQTGIRNLFWTMFANGSHTSYTRAYESCKILLVCFRLLRICANLVLPQRNKCTPTNIHTHVFCICLSANELVLLIKTSTHARNDTLNRESQNSQKVKASHAKWSCLSLDDSWWQEYSYSCVLYGRR